MQCGGKDVKTEMSIPHVTVSCGVLGLFGRKTVRADIFCAEGTKWRDGQCHPNAPSAEEEDSSRTLPDRGIDDEDMNIFVYSAENLPSSKKYSGKRFVPRNTQVSLVADYAQCGGETWTGGTVCSNPTSTCTRHDDFYSLCLPEHHAASHASNACSGRSGGVTG